MLNAYIILFAKEKVNSSVMARIFLALGLNQTSQHLSKKQSRAVAMNKYSSLVQAHLFQWYQPKPAQYRKRLSLSAFFRLHQDDVLHFKHII